jgi:hypothetical protein
MMTPYHPSKKYPKNLSPRKMALFVAVVFIVGLVFHNTHDALFGARLSIQTVDDGAILGESYLPISGNAKNAKELTINGRPITLSKEGDFEEAILLSSGYNIAQVRLVDRFGKVQEKTYHLVFDERDTSLAQIENDNKNQ